MKEPNVIMDKLAVVLFLAAVVVVALAGAEEEPATQQKVRAERRDQASYAVELCSSPNIMSHDSYEKNQFLTYKKNCFLANN